MYKIHTLENHLLVEFEEDFDYNTLRAVIHHETLMSEYAAMNDIWWVGRHHALVTLGDLESMVAAFRERCPRDATRKKTAIVVDQGLTEAILQLWVKAAENRIPFKLRVFHTLEEAEAWLCISPIKVV